MAIQHHRTPKRTVIEYAFDNYASRRPGVGVVKQLRRAIMTRTERQVRRATLRKQTGIKLSRDGFGRVVRPASMLKAAAQAARNEEFSIAKVMAALA